MRTNSPRLATPIRRRSFLRLGSLLPLGLTCQAFASEGRVSDSRRPAKSCILLWLDGGPSHLETFDVKPDAPAEVRGPFDAIDTRVPGFPICELLPRTAQVADKLAVIRSLTSPLGEHGLANHYLLTGYKPSPVLRYPSLGSVVSRLRSDKSLLPPYIAIPEARGTAGAGFLGAEHEPFATGGDPARPDFAVRDLNPFPGVDEARLRRRRAYLEQFDRDARPAATESDDNRELGGSLERAYQLVMSPEAQRAFALAEETDSLRARYGPRSFGQSCLLARRLVERGVSFVTVQFTGWDTHENQVLALRDGYSGAKVGVGLIPTFDQAFAALLEDLDQRGMLDETLVVAMGEFGRTPKLNSRGGRDHWPRVFSAVVAGGGTRGGQVIGASDRTGESPLDNPITPSDLARTLYHRLGISGDDELRTPDGRPIAINQGGKLIKELT